MSLPSWLSPLARSTRSTRKATAPRRIRARDLSVEHLESRLVPTAHVVQSNMTFATIQAANVDAAEGIINQDSGGNDVAISALTVKNNIVQNFSSDSIEIANGSSSVAGTLTTGSLFRGLRTFEIRLASLPQRNRPT